MAVRKKQKHSVDDTMLNMAKCLIRDFQENLGDPCFCCDLSSVLHTKDLTRIREALPEIDWAMDVATFKATYQVLSLFKRYRFENDLYTDEELEAEAVKKFLSTQNRLSVISFDSLSLLTERVVTVAKQLMASYLGPYDEEEHRRLCRFGKRASVGIPGRLACEAERWEIPISGSQNQIDWFDSEMSEIESVKNYMTSQQVVRPNDAFYQSTDSLELTLVPKTFKSLRSIMPNTTIGGYMSFGLGEMMRRRLLRKGFDLSTLQERHKVLACRASKSGRLVTADLSSASDCITDALLERLLPPDWLAVLRQSRIGVVVLPDGQRIESLTFCTMGIGYTFPLQTLVFLTLLKAVQATMKYRRHESRTISVYGDDMIYPLVQHDRVVACFEELGFLINVEKTFVEPGFRESCGGDYFHGVDVRPFQPRNGSAHVGDKAYEAVLYKFINGLLRRWTEYELRYTLEYLLSQVEAVCHVAKVVPGSYPDDSGIRCPTLSFWNFLPSERRAKLKNIGSGVYRFPFLRFKPEERKETRHEPYLWLSLRCPPSHDLHRSHGDRRPDPTRVQRNIALLTGTGLVASPLIVRVDEPHLTTRSKNTGRRLRRTSTYVTIGHTGRYKRQSGTSSFDDRS